MLPNGIGKLETGDRRMDVDDLMALAVALGVNPTRLLLPVHYRDDDEPVAITEATSCPAWRAWRWAEGFAPFDDDISSGDWSRYEDFHLHSRPAQMRQAEQHPAARVTAAIRERVLRLVRTPSAEGTRDAVVKGVERDLERLRFELEDLRGGQQAGEGSRG